MITVLKNVCKIHGKTPVSESPLNKVAGWKISQNSEENTCAGVSILIKLQAEKISKLTRKHLCRSLVFNKVASWKGNINIKLLIHLHFFIAPLKSKPNFFVSFTQCALIHNWKVK